jgi:hypothetical protein
MPGARVYPKSNKHSRVAAGNMLCSDFSHEPLSTVNVYEHLVLILYHPGESIGMS